MAYPEGMFSWTDVGLPNPQAGSDFYCELFGWEADEQQGPEGDWVYLLCKLDGKAVAGIGSQPPGAEDMPPMWTSYVAVADLDQALQRWTGAGGSVLMPAMDVMAAGRMAVVADPEGAVLALWQAGDHAGAEAFNQPGAMTWNELNTRNSAAARQFYGSVFDWGFEPFGAEGAPGEYWIITLDKPAGGPAAADNYNGGILTMDENWPAEIPPHWMVYFNVADMDETIDRLKNLGGTVSVPPFDTPAGRMAVVGDSQGGTFSVISPPAG